MGKHYTQLTFEERCEVARLLAAGTSQRKIATALGRAPSTITREVNRNGSQTAGYEPRYADDQAWARCWRGSKLERDDALREVVLGYLRAGWSPEQVAGYLAREAGAPVISHETIYRFIYAQQARTKDGNWRQYLPRAKSKRAGAGAKAAVRPRSLPSAVPWQNGPKRRQTAKPPATGRWT